MFQLESKEQEDIVSRQKNVLIKETMKGDVLMLPSYVPERKNPGNCILGLNITELLFCSASKKHFQVSVLSSQICCFILKSSKKGLVAAY